jgi:zinc ribbon protein
MFCPKCATQNLEGASFCRVCGANISLVPQAISGQLQVEKEDSSQGACGTRRRGREVGLDSAFRSAFMGLGFLFVSIALAFSGMGRGWWFFMLIPAFSMMGTGVAQYIRVKEREKKALRQNTMAQPVFQPSPRVTAFPIRNTGELPAPPSSVTEGTTRHLGVEPPTRQFDASTEVHK